MVDSSPSLTRGGRQHVWCIDAKDDFIAFISKYCCVTNKMLNCKYNRSSTVSSIDLWIIESNNRIRIHSCATLHFDIRTYNPFVAAYKNNLTKLQVRSMRKLY